MPLSDAESSAGDEVCFDRRVAEVVEDLVLGAAVVRDKFCSCFSRSVAKSSDKPMTPDEAVDYCSKQLGEK